jgi:hypothetical protein
VSTTSRDESDAPPPESRRAPSFPGGAIEQIARQNGLTPHVAHDVGAAWRVAVFRRENKPSAGSDDATARLPKASSTDDDQG